MADIISNSKRDYIIRGLYDNIQKSIPARDGKWCANTSCDNSTIIDDIGTGVTISKCGNLWK